MKNEISKILNLIQVGNTSGAIELAKALYISNPNNIDATKIFAYALIQIGRFEKVIEVLESGYKAADNNRDYDFYNNIGYAYLQLESFHKAIAFLEQAVKIRPESVQAYISLANVYQKLKKFHRAEFFINRALEMSRNDPKGFEIENNINLLLLKSEVNSALEKNDETIILFAELLDKSFNADLFFLLSRIDSNSISEQLVNLAETKLNLSEKDNFKSLIQKTNFDASIFYGLGNYFQKKNKIKSEEYYIKANDKVFNIARYNSHQYQENINLIIESYLKFFDQDNLFDTTMGDENFFIVGSPRSGTTLVESIITSNNWVYSGGELNLAKRIMEGFISSKDKNIKKLKETFQNSYLTETGFMRNDLKYLVDKMPENFLYLGFLTKLLPTSKFIRIFRNPWDTATSLYKERYIFNVPYSTSFFNIGIFLSNFEAINSFWSNTIQNKENIFDIKYEELVSRPEQSQKSLYEFIEIDYSERRNT
jgi:tetratricopeptide (TPR) repeat protein